MDILRQLKEIQTYYEVTRQAGHTVGMINGIKETENPVVMVANLDQGRHLKKTVEKLPKNTVFYSINSPHGLRGYKKPLFIDNAAMWMLCKKAAEEIERLEVKCKVLESRKYNWKG